MAPPLLSINNLTTSFTTPDGTFPAVRGLNLAIHSGRIVALVGESGSGKSLTALSIMRLVPQPGHIDAGTIMFEERDLLQLPENEMRLLRGSRISMIFQEPMTSLNPVLRIGDQIMEPLLLHRAIPRTEAYASGVALLHKVGIPGAQDRMRDYPHQLSGGMRQRVMIAMALACNPALLIADEPTTALDVTIQAQILELLDNLRMSRDMGILLITHDLGIVAERTDVTHVMYAGRIVESAPTQRLLANPRHPYTVGLLASLPQNAAPGTPLATMPGQVPSLSSEIPGCGFCNRCPDALPPCRTEIPLFQEIEPEHFVRCWKTL